MTLSRKFPLPESRLADSAPPARFKSGRRAPGVVDRFRTDRSRPIHGAVAPTSKLSTKPGQVQNQKFPTGLAPTTTATTTTKPVGICGR